MIQTGWSKRAVIRYALIQLPGIALAGIVLILLATFMQLSWWVACLGFALWVGKDILLFFVLWPAYDDQAQDVYSCIGKTAIARTSLDPRGSVRMQGQIWKAEIHPDSQPIESGTQVEVVDRDGLRLIVSQKDQSASGVDENGRSEDYLG